MVKDSKPTAGGREPVVSSETPITRPEGDASYVAAPCPVCHDPRATLRTIQLELPYFGEVFETVFMCSACGFRHADTLIPHVGEPTEFTLRIEGERDLFIRAVKSSSATVEVPELGLMWEPGPASEAEVTNVEGLLVRFEEAVGRARVLFPGPEAQARADELTEQLRVLRDGRGQATLVIRDPYGNSALVDDAARVRRRVLLPEEAMALATGEYILQASPAGRPEQLRRAHDHPAH